MEKPAPWVATPVNNLKGETKRNRIGKFPIRFLFSSLYELERFVVNFIAFVSEEAQLAVHE